MKTGFSAPFRALILALMSLTLLPACEEAPDPCATTACAQGNCEAGICSCDAGYYGSACDSTWADLFPGTYEVHEFYDDTVHLYQATVSSGSALSINIQNLHNQGAQTGATYDSLNRFSLAGSTAGAWNIVQGSLGANRIDTILNAEYRLEQGGVQRHCIATLYRE